MDINQENNRVLLCGTMAGAPQYSHSAGGQRFYSFPLQVLRLSGSSDVLNIVLRREQLDAVEDGEALQAALDRHIRRTLPTWASGGVLSGELTLRRLYTRDAYLTDERDMLLLITGAAPVFYYDQTGRYARA